MPTNSAQPRWLIAARKYIGLKEVVGSGNNPEIVAMWKKLGLPFRDDATPGCAGFVLENSGIRSTRSGLALSYASADLVWADRNWSGAPRCLDGSSNVSQGFRTWNGHPSADIKTTERLHFTKVVENVLREKVLSGPATCGMGKMIGNLFLFSGRMGRLKFFLTSYICVPLVMMITFLIMPLMAIFVFHASDEKKIFLFMFIPVVVVFIGVMLSLQAARLRDIGWSPLKVILALIIFDLADLAVAYLFPSLRVGGKQFTYASSTLNLVLEVILLFTPSFDDQSIPSILLPDLRLPRLLSKNWRSAKSDPKPKASIDPVRETVSRPRTSFGRLGLD